MAAQLSDQARALLDGRSFAVVATIQPDGGPQASVVWVKRDGDDILFSTVQGRRKHLNLLRDPRVSVVVNPPEDPYTYLEVRGEATLSTEGGRELIDELSNKYMGKDYGFDGPEAVRVVVRITPSKVAGSI
ncbi:PPOX class probable F420-dependent enzyme [Kitasatospora sp. MAA4]|uniref:PPOX class F420-dependent oxidoreductase n=1 Tax=Kitasatospora sp. MAA4 TaxID=3035093 RepID=UPI00247468FC|nr:PPOX class F420-dependent oxidoreductase [Kitasatospora sp. MAA4]MDH6135359.1 PPOX class probable F420-dependent enzyme [Kitasatospora sp. MAA4]